MSAPEDPKVVAARAKAEQAKQRFLSSAHELQARLKPAALADQAKTAVYDRGEKIADEASSFALQRPAVVGGVAAAGVLLLARKPIARLFRRKPKSDPTAPSGAAAHSGDNQ